MNCFARTGRPWSPDRQTGDQTGPGVFPLKVLGQKLLLWRQGFIGSKILRCQLV